MLVRCVLDHTVVRMTACFGVHDAGVRAAVTGADGRALALYAAPPDMTLGNHEQAA
ncbi:MAG: hypothetical protein GX446_00850 [Chthonomonadales bacterium]|nr:hypothetical protein [Chthonomonadales bacterium]